MSKRVVLTVFRRHPLRTSANRSRAASAPGPTTWSLREASMLTFSTMPAAAKRSRAEWARVLEKLGGPNLVLAYACWKVRKSCQAIVTDGEQVGLPLAALLKLTPRHTARAI